MAEPDRRLTKAQARILRSVSDGEVCRRFDVYAGYWWVERGSRLPAYGKSEHFPPLPIRYLLQKKLIAEGATVRPDSGYHEVKYDLTDAGRAALAQSEGK